MESQAFDRFFRSAPTQIDVEGIRQEWLALSPDLHINERHLPLPIWARRGLSDGAEAAWDALTHDAEQADPRRAFCIYIHIPFCSRRCNFCDCYSFPLRQHINRHIESYIVLLCQEMQMWGGLPMLAHRPVSTIHFGGGTPSVLGVEPFALLIESCREKFGTDEHTEWALETTSTEFTPEMADCLFKLGFTRLHIGIQSLDENVRRLAGRKESSAVVVEKIVRAICQGWVTSVDLIYGLPGQTLNSLLDDIQTLADAGVDGFSLYELQVSSHNWAFAEQHQLTGRDRTQDYFLFQAATQQLAALGYHKMMFNHFARERDTDLYFTFPQRDEDCLALGTISDGVFGDYHYRHPTYGAYCRNVNSISPGLQGGLRRTQQENTLQTLETAILSARLSRDLFASVLGREQAHNLINKWETLGLVVDDPVPGELCLTASGSWFAGEMMADLVRFVPSTL